VKDNLALDKNSFFQNTKHQCHLEGREELQEEEMTSAPYRKFSVSTGLI